MPTLVCLPIAVSDAHAALDDAMAARDLGADLVEFRLDAWFEGLLAQSEDASAAVLDLVARCELPSIVTCRPEWEGGEYHGDEQARLELFEFLLGDAGGPRYVDIELEAFKRTPELVGRIARCQCGDGCGLIVSIHDFDGRPADLSRRLAAAHGLGIGEVIKIAYRARSLRDNLELFEILRGGHRPTIAMGMGRFGLASRVLAPKFGGMLTFASLRDSSATAPGQPTIADLLGLYRFRSIRPSTRVYGVVGWPIDHSMSPTIQNAGFEAVGHDGVYLPLPVASGNDSEDAWASFKATIGAWIDDPALDFCGASVTLPHKQNLVRLAIERGYRLDDLSRLSGAGNTLVREGDGGWSVRNTDGPAAVDPLDEALGGISGKTVIVLGAGGGARAVVFELAMRHAIVIVCNRSAPRAERLVAEANAKLGKGSVRVGLLDDDLAGDALINCTPVGMFGGPEGSPVTESQLGSIAGLKVVEDTVYNPPETPLVKMATNQMATNRGLRAFGGVEMFVRQGAAQFQAWTGSPAPSGLFERIVQEELRRKE